SRDHRSSALTICRHREARDRAGDYDQVSAVFLFQADGSVLLQHRDDKPGLRDAGMWVPPGGHCDPGEEPVDGARREFFEETAYQCKNLHYLTSVVCDHQDGGRVQLLHLFWDRHDGVSPLTCLEGQDLRFMSRTTADRLPMPDYLRGLWD